MDVITLLLERGADVNAVTKDGATALHFAARSCNSSLATLLLDRGANVNAVTTEKFLHGETALHIAARSCNTDVITLLLDRGADKNALTKYGEIALHFAARSGNMDVITLLLERGADVNAVTKDGATALHFAAGSCNSSLATLLLDRGANIDAVDKENHSPLITNICHSLIWNFDEIIAVTRLLCSRGSNPNSLALKDRISLRQSQMVLLACARHWHQCYEREEPLTEIPTEVMQGGEVAIGTFIGDLAKTRSNQLVYRSKVCIVGPSTWGKTSLIKSVTKNRPVLVDVKDRTIGIDLFRFSFDENNNHGTTSKVKWYKAKFWKRNDETRLKVKRHDVTFWDFAGQDIYHVTHALFYSKSTLYLVCVDLSVYATKLEDVKTCKNIEKDVILQRFFEENVLRWVRLILFRQPSAQFKVLGTKEDLVSEIQLKDISVDMNYRMNSFLDSFDKDGVTDEVKSALDAEFKSNNLVTTSANRIKSIKQARKSIEQAIIAKPNLSFMMPATYSQVLAQIVKFKRASERAKPEDRVEQVVIPFGELYAKLGSVVPNLEDAGECREILRVLHRLGDILWFEDENTNRYELIIFDPKLMLELVREVVNHSYEGQTGECYDALRRDGTLHHSLLMTFPWWKALEVVDMKMVHLFKHLLQHFNLAYPASNVKELDTVNMIVPTYWKTRVAARTIIKPLERPPFELTHNYITGLANAKWQYSLPVDISDAVYVNYVVRCYRQNVVRKIGPTYVECFVRGEFVAVITFVADETDHCDDITIEVAAPTEDIAWAEMREFVMSMESVLLKYPGLKSTKQKMFERYIVDPNGDPKRDRVVVSGLMEDPNEVERLRYEMPWLPPDFDWFIQRTWENPGKLKELRVQKTTLQLSHRMEVLKQLAVSGETRHFPALWTLSYSKEADAAEIELRIHSDLTGVCYHMPLRIAVPSDFVMRHSNLIQDGVSVLSVVTSLIPIDVASNAVEMALSASKSLMDHTQTVRSVLAKAGLCRGETKSAMELEIPVQSRMSFLRDLLKLHDPTFDDLKVSELSNLCCAVSNEGCYVWVHSRELKEMNGHLTPCHPPVLLRMKPMGNSTYSVSANPRSKNEETVLMRGAGKGNLKVVRYLSDQGADTGDVEDNGNSPHIYLVQLTEDEVRAGPIANVLLEHDITVLHSNMDGYSARSIARRKNFHEVLDQIEEYDKKQNVLTPTVYSLQDDLLIPRNDLKIGRLLCDGGAFGVVYRGTWKRMDVVIKEIRGIASPAEMRTFLREARVWHGARHKNIVSFFGANDREPPYFLVSEFASNGNLIQYLDKEKKNGRSVVWRKILDVTVGLDVLHSKGIIHGDLKGNNIVVSADGTAMLTDFELSCFEDGSLSMPANLNPRWRAPEYVNGTNTRPSVESDVFALGMCIVEIMTGEPPWAGLQDNPAIRYNLEKKIPMLKPSSMTDRDWELVERMICYIRSERISLKDAIAKIEQFAEAEANAKEESSLAQVDSIKPDVE